MDAPLAVKAFLVAAFVAVVIYLGSVLVVLLDQVVPIWFAAAIFALLFVVLIVVEIATSKPPPPPEPPADE